MAKGGKREGAGRPQGSKAPHTIETEAAKKRLIERIKDDLDKIYDAWLASAIGYYAEVKTPDGKVRVYKKQPNPIAADALMNRAFGRPKEQIEHSGDIKITELEVDL